MSVFAEGISDARLYELLNKPNPVIVECGCHDGRDTKRFLDLFEDCRIVCIEPDPRPIERHDPPGFFDRIGDDPRVSLYRVALGDRTRMAVFHGSSGAPPSQPGLDWDHSGSLQEPSGHLEWSPWCTFPPEREFTVQVVALDSIAGNLDIDLLWVDVQGSQVSLLAGAKLALARTRYLFIECHNRPMYDGEPTQDEMLTSLKSINFEWVAKYEGYNFLLKNTRLVDA